MRESITTEYKMASKKIQIFGVFFRRHLFLLNCNFVKTKAWLVVNNFSPSTVAKSLHGEQILVAEELPMPFNEGVMVIRHENKKASPLAQTGFSAFGFIERTSISIRSEQG